MQSEAELEAAKCIQIAKTAWAEEDIGKALRFAEKALRLHSSPEAQSLIVKLKSGVKPPRRQPPTATSPSIAQSTSPSREETDAPQRAFTKAQADLCAKVMAAKTLYKVLGVETSASEDQIKKAYRKLAMQLHPDKNNAPRAEDAFKRISTAFQVLSDAGARRQYDQSGSAMPTHTANFAHRGGYPAGGPFMTPEDLFAQFFFPQGATHIYSTQRGAHPFRQQAQPPPQRQMTEIQRRVQNFLQVLPILLVLLFSLLNSWGGSSRPSPSFSMTRTGGTTYEMHTKAHGVTFYSSGRRFEAEYPTHSASRQEVEAEVEYYWSKMRCDNRTHNERREFNFAKSMGSRRRLKIAQDALRAAEAADKYCLMKKDVAKKFPQAAKRVDTRKSLLSETADLWVW